VPSDPTNPFAPDDPPWWWQSIATPSAFQPTAPLGGPFGAALGAAPSNNWPSSPGLGSLMPGQMTLGLNTPLGAHSVVPPARPPTIGRLPPA
jgi:hypothetical protein